jgi:ribose transport system substrate-binding protein
VDETVAIPGVDYVTLIGSDMVMEGKLTARWLIDKTGAKAKIVEFEGTIGSSAAVGRKKGFDDEIAQHADMQILTSQSADFDVKAAYELALQLLPKYSTADWIFSHNDGMSFGIIQALQKLNRVPGQDIGIVSIDGTKQGAQDVVDGLIAEITECNPKFGPIVFDTIEKYARGEPVPTALMNTDRTFDSTNIASYMPEAF